MDEDEDYLASIPQDVRIEKIDGSTLPLSEDIAARLSSDQHLGAGFTYCLRLRAEILDIRIVYLEEAIDWPFDTASTMSSYAARATRDDRVEDSEDGDEESRRAYAKESAWFMFWQRVIRIPCVRNNVDHI